MYPVYTTFLNLGNSYADSYICLLNGHHSTECQSDSAVHPIPLSQTPGWASNNQTPVCASNNQTPGWASNNQSPGWASNNQTPGWASNNQTPGCASHRKVKLYSVQDRIEKFAGLWLLLKKLGLFIRGLDGLESGKYYR